MEMYDTTQMRLARLEDRLAELEAIFRTTNEMVVDHEAKFVREGDEYRQLRDVERDDRLKVYAELARLRKAVYECALRLHIRSPGGARVSLFYSLHPDGITCARKGAEPCPYCRALADSKGEQNG